ncbi:sensor histidine kinase [Corallococcus macrosporus]|uniref:histidine kinase n=1 Tax=Corallococcus macrosporus DSM 14697 TaxID=1189310 RepID=A0A250JLN1_9BACT|nr:ATP-binding protein [Corallococcus macrosporus]ATB44789.1 PAS domain-containing sensor histidine kinase [Corallococcus macrosporus DSM 14697]
MEALLRVSPVAIHLLDLDGTVRLWNPAAERLFGWRQDDVLGHRAPWATGARWETFLHHQEQAARGLAPSSLELELHRRDGTPVQVELWTAPMPSSTGPAQHLALLVDLTERRRDEAARQRLLDASDGLASSLDPDATLEHLVRLAVPAHAESCRVFREDVPGQPRRVASAGVEARSPATTEAAALPDGATVSPDEATVSRVIATGEPALHAGPPSWLCVPLARTGALVLSTSERAYTLRELALARELTRRASLALDNARLYHEARQALRARDEVLAIASHELKSPISALRLQVQSLRAALERAPEALLRERLHRGLDLVGRQVKRQAKLIDALLDVSRIHAGRLALTPEPVDLSALVREVAERLELEFAGTGAHLTLTLPTDAHGHWDRLRLDQVLTNLVSNAVKYGRGNPVEVALSSTDAQVRLDVRDAGIGIAPEHLPRLFHRFERAVSDRDYGGVGLGLWIVREVVEAMGGHVSASSSPGVGSTFTVVLPKTRG